MCICRVGLSHTYHRSCVLIPCQCSALGAIDYCVCACFALQGADLTEHVLLLLAAPRQHELARSTWACPSAAQPDCTHCFSPHHDSPQLVSDLTCLAAKLVRHLSFYFQPFLPLSLQRVDAMSSRLKSLGFGSKRKSNASLPSTAVSGPSSATAPGSGVPTNTGTGSGSAQTPNGSTSAANTPPPPPTANASQTSLAPSGMNQQQQGLGRPPSYQPGSVAGRPQSPMPPPGQQPGSHYPPPIDTSRGYVGANPQMAQQPPGYGGAGYGQMQQPPPQQMGQYGQHVRPAEVDGGNRSKAQLIVGIDFVSTCLAGIREPTLTNIGNYLLRRRLCLRY